VSLPREALKITEQGRHGALRLIYFLWSRSAAHPSQPSAAESGLSSWRQGACLWQSVTLGNQSASPSAVE
jgi:hypothetical protein